MIVGISGLAGSGKDTAADFMVKNYGFIKMGLADHIKRMCRDTFDFTDEQLWGPSSARNAPDTRYPREHTFWSFDKAVWREQYSDTCLCCGAGTDGTCYLTPRYALQQLGTEWGRDCYQDVWIAGALRTAKAILSMDPVLRPCYSAQRGLYYADIKTAGSKPGNGGRVLGVVFSDIRFKNEMAAISAADGWLWRMKRGEGLGGSAGAHPSEAEQLEVPDDDFNVVIENKEPVMVDTHYGDGDPEYEEVEEGMTLEELEELVCKHVVALHALETGAFA